MQVLRAIWASLLLALLSAQAAAFQASEDQPLGQTIVSSGSIQVAFSPEDDIGEIITDAIRGAQKQILVQAFSFTHRKIAAALLEAKRRGVDVRLIADAEQLNRMEWGRVPELAADGVPTFIDAQHDSAHNKVMIIDQGTSRALLITGSLNFTQAAQYRNAENLLLFRGNPGLVQAYFANWQHHRAHSTPFSAHR